MVCRRRPTTSSVSQSTCTPAVPKSISRARGSTARPSLPVSRTSSLPSRLAYQIGRNPRDLARPRGIPQPRTTGSSSDKGSTTWARRAREGRSGLRHAGPRRRNAYEPSRHRPRQDTQQRATGCGYRLVTGPSSCQLSHGNGFRSTSAGTGSRRATRMRPRVFAVSLRWGLGARGAGQTRVGPP